MFRVSKTTCTIISRIKGLTMSNLLNKLTSQEPAVVTVAEITNIKLCQAAIGLILTINLFI